MFQTTCPAPVRKVAWHLYGTAGNESFSNPPSLRVKPTDRPVQPRLVSSAIREPTVGAADGDIENKVECYQRKKVIFVKGAFRESHIR